MLSARQRATIFKSKTPKKCFSVYMSKKKVVTKRIALCFGVVVVALAALLALMTFGIIPAISTPAKLVNVGIGGTYYPAGKLVQGQLLSSNSLEVTGWVCNAGSLTAYNAKLHVVVTYLAPNGTTVVAVDTYIAIGNTYPINGVIDGFQSVYVNSFISYPSSVSEAGMWKINPEWTNLP